MKYERLTKKEYLNKPKCFNCEYNYLNCSICERYCVDGDYFQLRQELKRLVQLEDKIEQGRLVDCIWFISWLNETVCCGQVIGYEEDSGFVILTNGSMISADKIWTNCEDAEKELLKRKIKELDEEEYQEFKAEAEKKLKELKSGG